MTQPSSQTSPRAGIGTALLFGGALLLFLCCVEAAGGLPVSMPRTWYVNQELWWFLAIAGIVGGAFILQSASRITVTPRWRPTRAGKRFTALVLYTRANCGLCDEARLVLEAYRQWLPEIVEIDIDLDARLVEKFGNCVPVVALDGKVRFKGRIAETLLRRLIEGTPPVA